MQEELTSDHAIVEHTEDEGDTFIIGSPLPIPGAGKGFSVLRRSEPRQSSAQRLILDTLKNASHDSRHLSIDDIFRHLMRGGEKISHSTIYRTLARMEAAGQVVRHQFVSGASVFEYSAPERHDHFVEIDSSKIIDFQSEELEALLLDIAGRHDVELLDLAGIPGKSRLERHRMVNQVLAEELAGKVHALAVTALTPDERSLPL